MIGILIISHSAAVARGVKELADQMAKGHVPIASAGGTHDGALGTSADLIIAALDDLKGADAVLALVDMGSAVMSAEMALEMSGVRFLISGAPLVEGALVAAVEAMRPEATLEEVAALAARALETKGVAAPLQPPGPAAAPQAPAAPVTAAPAAEAAAATPQSAEMTLTIFNKVGLHMRPAKEFVRTATGFASTVRVSNLDRPERPEGNAKSIVDVMKLGVASGHRIAVRATGDDAQAALDAISKLVADNFGEP